MHFIIIGVVLLTFVCFMLLVIGLASPAHDQNALGYRIESIARSMDMEDTSLPSLADSQLGVGIGDRVIRPAMRAMGQKALRMSPAGATDEMRKMLVKAGNPYRIGVPEFTLIKVVFIVLFVIVGFVAQYFGGSDSLTRMMIFGLCVLMGFIGPDVMCQRFIAARQAVIRRRLPDIIDLLIVSVEAGLGFDGAIAKVVEKMKGPVSEEFGRALDEMRLGKPRGVALKDMAARIDLPEVTSFVAAVYQSEQLGVSIANCLRVQSDTIRTARFQRIREAAAKLPVKMLFPMIFFIFPAIFIVLMGPGILSIQDAFKHM